MTIRHSDPKPDCARCHGSGIVRVSKDPDEVADCVCTDPPVRIQLSRRKGWRKPENTVVVARPSKWGNPFRVGDAQVRMPALDGGDWEHEGRLHKTSGQKHVFCSWSPELATSSHGIRWKTRRPLSASRCSAST